MKSPVPPYAELACATNFSFLRGASPAVDLVFARLLLGYRGLGIADRNTLAGVVRAWSALRDLREGGIPPPIRLREGSGPGEFRFETRTIPSAPEQPTPDEAGENALRTLLKARAESFRLATGARLAFEDLQLLRYSGCRAVRRRRNRRDTAAVGELPEQLEAADIHEDSLHGYFRKVSLFYMVVTA